MTKAKMENRATQRWSVVSYPELNKKSDHGFKDEQKERSFTRRLSAQDVGVRETFDTFFKNFPFGD